MMSQNSRTLGCGLFIDSGADVALFPLSMANHEEGELQFSTKTKLQDAQGNRTQEVRKVLKFPCMTLMDEKFF